MAFVEKNCVIMRSVSLLGVRIDDITRNELSARFLDFLNGSTANLVVTPNPEFLLAARSDAAFRDVLNASVLALPDGVALRFAAAALHDLHNLHRYPGIDVLPMLAEMCRDREVPLVLLGGTDDILVQIQMRFTTLFQGIKIITINPGSVSHQNPCIERGIIERIRGLGPCVVAVALGQGNGRSQGKQERVAAQITSSVPNARIIIGVGGAFDVLSGRIRRAPMTFQRLGFEWLWRLFIEPWRIRRIFRAVIIFPIIVARDTIQSRRFIRSVISVIGELRSHFLSRS